MMDTDRKPHVHDDDESLHHHPEDVRPAHPEVTGAAVADTHVHDDDESLHHHHDDAKSDKRDGQE